MGLPALAGDITGARSELTGLSVQELRVAFPALALGLLLTAGGRPRAWRLGVVRGHPRAARLRDRRWPAGTSPPSSSRSCWSVSGWRAGACPGAGWPPGPSSRLVAFGGIQVLRAYEQADGRELAFAVERTINRVILIQPRTLEALQDVIPDEQPYFGGLDLGAPARPAGRATGHPQPRLLDLPTRLPRPGPARLPRARGHRRGLGELRAGRALGLFALLGVGIERLGAVLARRRRGTGDLIAGAMLVVFVARTHALGVNGVAILIALVIAWRLLAAGGVGGLWRDVRATLAWRT